MDNGLVLHVKKNPKTGKLFCLNPCCSGQWSHTIVHLLVLLNFLMSVLILVVVDNGLVHEIRMRVEGLTPES